MKTINISKYIAGSKGIRKMSQNVLHEEGGGEIPTQLVLSEIRVLQKVRISCLTKVNSNRWKFL